MTPPPEIICDLCHEFYSHGWMTGTGGAMTLLEEEKLYVTPSGVFKERLKPQDLYVLHSSTSEVLSKPALLKQSDSTPVFRAIHKLTGAGCCIHSHSQSAVLAAISGATWKITNQEMIKGVRRGGTREAYRNVDELIVPIIENKPTESELTDGISKAIQEYPDAPCVLIEGHGVYLWAENWTKAKAAAECLDYLFELSYKLRRA